MNFYVDWNNDFRDGKNCNSYIRQFLLKDPQTVALLLSGDVTELESAYNVLKDIPIENFFEVVLTLRTDRAIKPAEVPQFSSFEDGANRIPELLEFYPDGENFTNLGYQIVAAKNEAANRKYGENHSRFAEMMGLVTVTESKPRYVSNTAWGKYLIQYSFEEKEDVFRKLLLREYFIQKFLQRAFQGTVSYFDLVSFLAESTAVRRRSNTRIVMELLLKNTDWECYLDNIIWK